MKIRMGSLFAGGGFLELGLERAGLGETIFQVEIDPYCQKVLARHWPTIVRFDDVRTVHGRGFAPKGGGTTRELPAVDLICGGFP